ncbi:MAG: AmmeMemoRadiSam system protein B [Bifidobacteriaceae bacterium]|jgi:AmmeMemoRadiSam system protein B|nr:AmmeMemoRadiSam system protein B [Bifidobacteriaceae bacterium]
MAMVRAPAVAGTFYPADPDRLAAEVVRHLENGRQALAARGGAPGVSPANVLGQPTDGAPARAPSPGGAGSVAAPRQSSAAPAKTPGQAPVKALIAPHAGYVYSGPTAGCAYAALGGSYERVVLMGPCHHVGTPFAALPGADWFRTPLGDVAVWQEGAQRVAELSEVITSSHIHEREHSLEVHLPFIQTALGPDIPVLPLAVGWSDPGAVAAVIEAVWGGPETLFVFSSDLSHYLPYDEAVSSDQATVKQILAGRLPLAGDQACGAYPVNGLLEVARRQPLRGELIDYRNSGDTAGDKSAVVGYAALTFRQEAPS